MIQKKSSLKTSGRNLGQQETTSIDTGEQMISSKEQQAITTKVKKTPANTLPTCLLHINYTEYLVQLHNFLLEIFTLIKMPPKNITKISNCATFLKHLPNSNYMRNV